MRFDTESGHDALLKNRVLRELLAKALAEGTIDNIAITYDQGLVYRLTTSRGHHEFDQERDLHRFLRTLMRQGHAASAAGQYGQGGGWSPYQAPAKRQPGVMMFR